MTEYDGFRLERDDARGVATITLDVPGKLNRVSMAERDQLAHLLAELGADDAVRFVAELPKSPSGKILRRLLREEVPTQ